MAQTHVSKRIECRALIPGCDWTGSADTETALLEKVAAHAAAAHGVTEVTPELAAQAKAAMTEERGDRR